MAKLIGFIASFLGAAIFAIAGGIPFSPLMILWVNFAIDVPIAIALGFGKPSGGLMERKPRPVQAPVVSRNQWIVIVILGLVMAVGTLLLLALAQPVGGVSAVVATTMGLAAFMLFQLFAGLEARDEIHTMFTRNIVEDRRQLSLYGLALLLTFLVTQVRFLQRIFATTQLSLVQWLVCIGVASTLVIVDEIIKFFLRRSRREVGSQPSAALPESADGHLEMHGENSSEWAHAS
jgi:Ca2+-transporting ATPase